MKLRELFLEELEREAPRSRRTLEQIPDGKAAWKNMIVNGDTHAIGEWLITVLVTLDSGEELRTSASLNVR